MKRFALLFVLLFALAPLTGIMAQDENPLRADDPFWNATQEHFDAWRVIDGVEEGAEITFWTMSLSPTFDEYIQKIVSNFEATYPEVTVKWEDQPWDSLQDKVRSSFTAGATPDVININPSWISEFAENGLLMDMDAALAAYPDVRAEYSDGAFNAMAYEGASYQIPWYLGLSNFVGYNTALLEELGIDAAELPTTWEGLRDFSQQVRDNSDYYATSLNFGSGTELNLLDYLIYNDVPVFDADGNVALNTPEAVEALQLWVDMLSNDLIPRDSLTDDHRQMIDRFSQGETVLIRVAPHMLRLVQESNADVYATLAVAPGITGTSGANAIDVQSLVVPAGTQYPNAALALAVFVTNAETQAAFSKEAAVFPSNLNSYGDEFFQSVDESNPTSVIRPLALEYVEGAEVRRPTFPNDAEVQQAIIDAQNAALLGEVSAEEALNNLSARINELISQ